MGSRLVAMGGPGSRSEATLASVSETTQPARHPTLREVAEVVAYGARRQPLLTPRGCPHPTREGSGGRSEATLARVSETTQPADQPGTRPAPVTEPLAVPIRRIVEMGIAAWAVALAVTLVVPSLHTGDRSWWPWSCVAGIVLGGIGWAYVRRGRGNIADG